MTKFIGILAIMAGVLLAALYIAACSDNGTSFNPERDCHAVNDSTSSCGDTEYRIY